MEYCNIWDYQDKNYPFQLFLGGRGTGKTFSALSDPVLKNRPFIYMRRTLDELELLQDANGAEGANPFRPINEAYHRNIGFGNCGMGRGGVDVLQGSRKDMARFET